ncbi:hypothetical protein [Microbaculum marinum]|uniref:Uncharacterized protein n=1 Tax=Microbaculum marinum TaxID=1764581 RepID=A0AAW9RXI9_9HYPH
MKRILTTAVAVLAVGAAAGPVQTARADGGVVAAGVAGLALGALFPFAYGYQYHPTGYWYVRDTSAYRYPVSYYRWYAPAGGYIYVGPNWRHWYQYRDAVYAPPPYFVVPPQRFVYYPPVPQYRYYYGANQKAGGYR